MWIPFLLEIQWSEQKDMSHHKRVYSKRNPLFLKKNNIEHSIYLMQFIKPHKKKLSNNLSFSAFQNGNKPFFHVVHVLGFYWTIIEIIIKYTEW